MNLIQSMEYRMPWPVARAIFKDCGIPTGRGWGNTESRMASINQDTSFVENINKCTSLYEGHIKHGGKNVKFYSVTNAQLEEIRLLIGTLDVSASIFSDSYPFIVDETLLEQAESDVHRLVRIDESDRGTYLIFASKRLIEKREVIDDADILEGVKEVVGAINELITIRRGPKQLFDVVFIPTSGQYIQLCVDHPKDMPAEYATLAQRRLRDTFFALIGFDEALEVLNLFPLIRSMYDNGNEGSVVEMDFSTNTASVKRERMRRSVSDLRTELYHHAGYTAISGNIDPYKIAIRWSGNGIGLSPELILNSSLRMLHAPNPFLFEAEIQSCVTEADYFHVVGRMFSYIQ